MTDETLRNDDDAAWRADGDRNGWFLPNKAAWPLRLPIVRWLRASLADYRIHRAASQWASAGVGLGPPNQRDLWVIYAISRGWC
ncbi:hypothetical protein [Methylobacterium sp. WL19]|uniref:hypothetical protein n=1 Tax=Methylobacterium sp. WL19 TaxID=2603896 RepID=UPI0011C78356|nr:hypothetical protein [Methylobacterium sp. WL19]TXN22083.1 hypothetical protein FV220_22420 [Methylobacterium sp. WL19]